MTATATATTTVYRRSLASSVDRLVVAGLSYRSEALPLLEQAARSDLAGTVRELGGADVEVVLLSTCHRLEVYAAAADPDRMVDGFVAAVSAATGVPSAQLRPHLYRHSGEPAVAHLFAVAAGLDSATVGEPQILAQLRQALNAARSTAAVGPGLQRVVERAVHSGRKVRGAAGFGAPRPSLADSALDQAAERLGSLRGRSAVVIGSGTMARLAVTGLRRRGIGALIVASRTPATGQALADRTAASWIDLAEPAELLAALRSADLVVSCTSADQYILDRGLVGASRTTTVPQVLVDLARPRDIDPAVAGLPEVELISLADLRTTGPVDELAAARAQRVVAADVQQELARLRAETAAGDIAALHTWAHGMADDEISRVMARLTTGDPATAALVQHAVRRTVNKLLHPQTMRLKQRAAAAVTPKEIS